LKKLDVDIPLGQMIVVTGVSGAGKSSLVFDTLYVEGQRRYVESFSTYARRFLERFEKPDADRIEPIPPAIAVRQKSGGRSRRATVGTVTEILDHLRVLFARAGRIVCPQCRRPVERHTPATAQAELAALDAGTRFMVCFPAARSPTGKEDGQEDALASRLVEAGFTRFVVDGRTVNSTASEMPLRLTSGCLVIVDRLTAGVTPPERLADSLELAFRHGAGSCVVLVQSRDAGVQPTTAPGSSGADLPPGDSANSVNEQLVDGIAYHVLPFNSKLICAECGREFVAPEPLLFNFNSPLGACPACRGTGEVAARDLPGRPQTCPSCRGARLCPEALAVLLAGKTIAEWTQLTAVELRGALAAGKFGRAEEERRICGPIVTQMTSRLDFLMDLGLGYLTLDRPARTLSGGEAQRVRLTAAFGSRFVNLLYVLDEPTSGLHPRDIQRLLTAIESLRSAGNSVVVVEHDSSVIRRADQVIDIGPGAGSDGGQIVFQGSPAVLAAHAQTATAEYLSGRRLVAARPDSVRREPAGWLRLEGVEHHNLHDFSVDIPLGILCIVTGVSGSGKSSLIEETLYPAARSLLDARPSPVDTRRPVDAGQAQSLREPPLESGRFSSLQGVDQIEDVLLIDQKPVGRSTRANLATILQIFGEIRSLFAATAEAKVRNLTARHFSFNSAGGGRCETCRGTGSIAVDMQFLPDVLVTCPDCRGTRYRREILEVRYRGLSIADVLGLTVRDAFSFFRGRTCIQRRLKVLRDAGLDYITLGQPADTLSGGESQRLKLAAFLARASRSRTLILMDEPTAGLHPADIVRLVDCLGQVLAAGHSLVVIEHNLDFIRCGDHIIELGPGAGAEGGRLVAAGRPEEIAGDRTSIIGPFLRDLPGPHS
jgi:excinuclease ABC subunit A